MEQYLTIEGDTADLIAYNRFGVTHGATEAILRANPGLAAGGTKLPQGMTISGAIQPGFETILTPEALAFVADLHRTFEPRRRELLAARDARQARIDSGEEQLGFLAETAAIRDGDKDEVGHIEQAARVVHQRIGRHAGRSSVGR